MKKIYILKFDINQNELVMRAKHQDVWPWHVKRIFGHANDTTDWIFCPTELVLPSKGPVTHAPLSPCDPLCRIV